jgi:hypothetical protein
MKKYNLKSQDIIHEKRRIRIGVMAMVKTVEKIREKIKEYAI